MNFDKLKASSNKRIQQKKDDISQLKKLLKGQEGVILALKANLKTNDSEKTVEESPQPQTVSKLDEAEQSSEGGISFEDMRKVETDDSLKDKLRKSYMSGRFKQRPGLKSDPLRETMVNNQQIQ